MTRDDPDERARRRAALRARCRLIHGHGAPDVTTEIERVAAWCRSHEPRADVYGAGGLVEDFERQVADLFGKPAARFLPTGTLAQSIALRIACGPGGWFGMHPTSHLELHEERGYTHLWGLRATLVGSAERPLLVSDLDAVRDPLQALLVELPTRENGGQLPTWDALVALSTRAKERGLHFHLDGARVWEAQAAYDRPLAEIAGLFDSVYVSFYKGIGALPGAMLLGTEDLIGETAAWQRRAGGNPATLLPNVASAASRLDERRLLFPRFHERARTLAAALTAVPGVRIVPDPPHVNMMHVELALAPEDALRRRDRVAEETGLWLFGYALPTGVAGRSRFELYVGDAALEVDDEDVTRGFRTLFDTTQL